MAVSPVASLLRTRSVNVPPTSIPIEYESEAAEAKIAYLEVLSISIIFCLTMKISPRFHLGMARPSAPISDIFAVG